jgi:putative transposase
MTRQVGPGLAKPEFLYGHQARSANEVRVSGFHRGPQRIGCNKAAYKTATHSVESNARNPGANGDVHIKEMIDRAHPLPVARQVKLVGISRSSAYYAPSPVSVADLALMRRIDELHLEHPFAGARMLMRLLKREGIAIGRKHVGTLMRKMGIEALYRKLNLSRKHLAHKIWPYLLRDRKIERSNQVFALDTTYVPMAQGFVYLTAVIDWASRRVLAHRVAITMEAEHAVAALEEAFAKYGLPEIVNTDQGSQGGFNRSSQHLKLRRCCHGSKCKAGVSVDRASSDVLTGCAVA